MARDPDSGRTVFRLTPLRICILFVVLGGVYIFVSDMLPSLLGFSIEAERMYQTLKGWGFVILMGVGLYVLMRRLDHSIRLSESRLRTLIDNLPALVAHVGPDGKLRLLNRQFGDWFGDRAKGFVGVDAADALGLNSNEIVKRHVDAALSGERITFEHELVTVKGTRPVNITFTPYSDARGEIMGLYLLVTDLTGQRTAESALRHSEERYRRLVEDAPVGILINQRNRFVYANQQAAKILGASSPEELIGRTALDHIAPEFRPIVEERIKAVLDRNEAVPRLEEKFLRLDGSIVDVEVAASGCVHEGGPAIQVVIRDISERLEAERARRESEEQYRRIVETTHEGVWVVDAEWRTTFMNRRMTEILGYSQNELLGRSALDLVAKDQLADAREMCSRREKGHSEDFELLLITRGGDGVWVHMVASPLLDEEGKFQGALAMVSDISQRRRADDRLRESESRFIAFMNNSPAGAWLKDEQGRYLFVNKTILDEYKLTEAEAIGSTDEDLFPPAVAAELRSNDLEALNSNRTIETRETIPNPDGQDHIWQILKFPVMDRDGQRLVGGFALDITDHVRSADEKQLLLTQLRERVKEMQTLNTVLNLLQDPSIEIDSALASVAETLPTGLRWSELAAARIVFAGREHRSARYGTSGDSISEEFTVGQDEVGLVEISYTSRSDLDSGAQTFIPEERDLLQSVAGLLRSFIERRRASEALERSESLYRHVVEAQSELLCRWTPDTTLTFVNPAYQRVFGGEDNAALVGRKWIDFIPQQNRAEMEQIITRALSARPDAGAITYENLAYDHAGRRRWLQWRDQPVFDESGRLIEVQSAGRDITERVEAEQALRLSEERFHIVAGATTDVIWDWNLVSNEIWWSDGLAQLFGHDLQRQASDIDWWSRLVHPDDRDRVTASLDRVLKGSSELAWSEEYRLRRGDGVYAFVNDRGEIIRDEQGKSIRMVGGITDITERKAAERRQKLMMQELDHRVKNNLATVLSIAESTFRVSESLDQFAESFTGRIRALARMHALLAYSRWEGVSLRQLMERTLEAYSMNQDSTVTIQGEDIELSPVAAPVLCMAVHELATNAAKYGSLSTPGGQISATWRVEEDDDAEGGANRIFKLEWRESGGPSVVAPARRGLGSDLIEGAVTYELNGSAEMRFHPDGLACTIQAPLRYIVPAHETDKPVANFS